MHEYTGDNFLNEAKFGYELYEWNPTSASNGPENQWFISSTNTVSNDREFMITGGSPNDQDRKQTAFTLQDDLTFTGVSGHNIKGGAKIKMEDIQLSGTPNLVPINQYLINNVTGNPIAGLNANDPTSTYFNQIAAIPPQNLDYRNNQIGLYLQDDWRVNNKLELNYGMRWDYESNMLDNDFVTPANIVAMLTGQDTRAGAPVGQTYAQSLAKGGININDYIATGNRTPFKKAIAPRLGFSYDVNGDKQTVFFGGVGRSYDRTMANFAMDEKSNDAVAGPGSPVYLITNNFKMPYTDQFSLGLRQAIGVWNGEIGLTYSESKNQFNWFSGNRWWDGSLNGAAPINPLWGSNAGFGNLVLGDFNGAAKTTTSYIKMEKPWTKTSGWSAGVTFTHSDGQLTNSNWTNNVFNWTAGEMGLGYNPSLDVERNRLVANGMTDNLLPWGMMLSGKLTVGSGLPYQITNCAVGWNNCIYQYGTGNGFKQVDMGISKDIKLGIGKFTARLDIINLFNTANYTGNDGWVGGPTSTPANRYGGDNAHFGVPTAMASYMRQLKLTVRYAF